MLRIQERESKKENLSSVLFNGIIWLSRSSLASLTAKLLLLCLYSFMKHVSVRLLYFHLIILKEKYKFQSLDQNLT